MYDIDEIYIRPLNYFHFCSGSPQNRLPPSPHPRSTPNHPRILEILHPPLVFLNKNAFQWDAYRPLIDHGVEKKGAGEMPKKCKKNAKNAKKCKKNLRGLNQTPLPPGADHPGSRHPPDQTPPGADTPRSRHPPWKQTPPLWTDRHL